MADYSEIALVRSLNFLAESQGSIAHNLANASSTAYKRRVAIAEQDRGFASMLQTTMPMVAYRETTDQADGAKTFTDQGLHVALQGDGFFRVKTGAGEYLTRFGELSVDSQGFLSTANGHRYLDANGSEISLAAEGVAPSSLLISPDGSITDGRDSSQTIGRLGVFTVDRPDLLEPAGTSLYRVPAQMPLKPSVARVEQRALEQSNVDSLSELINMIVVQRSFEATSRTLRTLDELKSAFVTAMNR